MKKLVLPFLCTVLLASSCKSTWTDEDKDMFRQSCIEDAMTWAKSSDQAKTYCNCVLEKTMARFPKVSDALEHVDSVINDPSIRACRADIAGK